MAMEREIIYEKHPVSPERKAELIAKGFRIIDARFDPNRGKSTDDDSYGTDEELRAAVEAATGKPPHHKMGRAKLIEAFEAARAAHQDETASNGLTRREIEADLNAMGIEFDPADRLDDLAALRDMAKEGRG